MTTKYQRIPLIVDYAKVTICISLGKYDIKEDAEEIVAALTKVVGRYSIIVPSS